MTNLTDKFTAFQTQSANQYQQVLIEFAETRARIDATTSALNTVNLNLNTIIQKLDALNTSVINNGTFDTVPITDAIAALRGTAPENTIYSINQSIWGIAGPAPGTNLAQLKAAIDALGGGKSLLSLFTLWDNGAGITPYNLLDNIYTSLVSLGATETAANAILVRLIAQFDTSAIYPTMKDLLMTISAQQLQQIGLAQNPLTTVPADICLAPLVSTGSYFQDTSMVMVDPVTFATWPADPGGDFSASYDLTMDAHPILHCTNWTNYRIYVASKADSFGVITGRGTRYPCNEWITLDIPEGLVGTGGAAFNVARANDLTVYICGQGDPVLGGCENGADPLIPSGWRVPTPSDQFWEMASGYNNGGITWSLDINVPHATAGGGGIGDTATRPAFIITTGDLAHLCVSWRGGRTDETLQLHMWMDIGGGNWVSEHAYVIRPGSGDAAGSTELYVQSGDTYAYTVFAAYPPDQFNSSPPSATVSISYVRDNMS